MTSTPAATASPRFLPGIFAVLLALAPILHISSYSLPSGLFYATLIAALALLAQKGFAGSRQVLKTYWPVMAAFSVLLLAVINSALHYGNWPGANGEGAIRFLVGLVLVLLAAGLVPNRWLKLAVTWGFIVAAVLAFGIVMWLTLPDFVRPKTPGNIPVAYSAFMALFAAVIALSIGWQTTPWPRLEVAVKCLAAALAIAALIFTQSRTGWLGVPLFVLVGAVLFVGMKNRKRAIIAVLLVGMAAAATFYSSDVMRHRTQQGLKEAVECTGQNSTKNTSVCIRFQMWRAALDMARQHPWVGIGDGGLFRDRMTTDSYPKGIVSKYVITEHFGEPHNDTIFMLATFGVPGALGMLLIYLAPALCFVKRLGLSQPQAARVAAAMGLVFCLGFAVFGLTETMFRRMNTMGFYAVFVAVFLVMSAPNRPAHSNNSKGDAT